MKCKSKSKRRSWSSSVLEEPKWLWEARKGKERKEEWQPVAAMEQKKKRVAWPNRPWREGGSNPWLPKKEKGRAAMVAAEEPGAAQRRAAESDDGGEGVGWAEIKKKKKMREAGEGESSRVAAEEEDEGCSDMGCLKGLRRG